MAAGVVMADTGPLPQSSLQRLLVVGDDPYERMTLRSLFEGARVAVDEAVGVGQAVRRLLDRSDTAAIVMSGDAASIATLTRWVRYWLDAPDLPLVGLTSRGHPVPAQSRSVVTIEKPLDLGSLRRAVLELAQLDIRRPGRPADWPAPAPVPSVRAPVTPLTPAVVG